jgi:hypothetical protein
MLDKMRTTMQVRYPLTIVQMHQTKDELRAMKEQVEAIYRLVSAGYGDNDQKTVRAGEIIGTIQRLLWELERAHVAHADAAVV